jgi:tetracycline repressor-like protein
LLSGGSTQRLSTLGLAVIASVYIGFAVADGRPAVREAGFSIEMTIQAYSVIDANIYGFALQEKTVPFDTAGDAAAVAQEQARQLEAQAQEQQLAALADEYPYIAEVVAGHVAKVGYDFAEAFEYGLDLILDALEQRRESPRV